MPPAFVLRRRKGHMQKRAPLRSLRFADQRHLRFLRQTISLSGVTRNAGADDVFPCGHPAAVTRDDMVEIEVVAVKSFSAVLADVFVPLEPIVSADFHFFFR